MSYHRPATNPVPTPGQPIEAKPPATPMFLRTTLMLEAVLMWFVALVAHGLQLADRKVIWGGALVVFIFLVMLGRLVHRSGVWIVASVAQVGVLALGFFIPMMFLVGGVFVLLWVACLVIGRKIDRERAAWDQEHPELAPNVA